jgi:hypothetical protein
MKIYGTEILQLPHKVVILIPDDYCVLGKAWLRVAGPYKRGAFDVIFSRTVSC